MVTLLGFWMGTQLPAQTGDQERKLSPDYSFGSRWGVKTNMLYNTLNFINVGVERNLGDCWGFEAEIICPWWNAHDNHRTTRMLNGGLELRRYWHRWTDTQKVLSGPYVGIHANGGIYDLVRNNQGVQSDGPFWMGGLVLGYGLMTGDSWRMNFAIGVGAMYTPYNHYHVVDNGMYLLSHYQGNYTYIGPTKAEVSVMMLLK